MITFPVVLTDGSFLDGEGFCSVVDTGADPPPVF